MAAQDLYQQLAESIGFRNSKVVPDILRKQADERDVQILLAAAPPATVAELVEKTGIPEDDMKDRIGALFFKGLIFKSMKKDTVQYYRPRHVIQFHDANILTPGLSEEVIALWRQYNKDEWPKDQDMITRFMPRAPVRVVPVNVAITPQTKILAFEDIKRILEDAKCLAVVNCTCRMVHGGCGKPMEVCIQVDKAADYTIERGTGREVTKEDVLDIMRLCEEEGLVHTVTNTRSGGNIICNCCNDCCINWPRTLKHETKFVVPSRFAASVDPEACVGCEACMDRCHFDAIAMDDGGETAAVNETKCMGCGICLVSCEFDALALKEVRPEDFILD